MFQESVCEDNASFDLSSIDIASCIEDCTQCIDLLMEKEEQGFSEEGSGLVPSILRIGFYYICGSNVSARFWMLYLFVLSCLMSKLI